MSLEVLKGDLERLSHNIEYLRRSRDESPAEWFKAVGQAQLLSQYYTGLETVFEKSLRWLEISIPTTGGGYHQEILNLALQHGLVAQPEREFLSDLLLFRHFVRHGYGVVFRPEEVENKALKSVEKWPSIRLHLEQKIGLA